MMDILELLRKNRVYFARWVRLSSFPGFRNCTKCGKRVGSGYECAKCHAFACSPCASGRCQTCGD